MRLPAMQCAVSSATCILVLCALTANLAGAQPTSPNTGSAAGPINISTLPKCPFSRWQGDPRYCYECRWCPFRAETCCEMEDEVDMLKSVNVSGTDDWDCFITIVYFQQCGRCSPSARSYVQNKLLPYVWDIRNLSIRPCRQSCEYIYKQCRSAKTLTGEPVIPTSLEEFCKEAPVSSTPELPCYNSAIRTTVWSAVVFAVTLILLC